MSLAIAIPTHHGIMMSADRRIMTTVYNEKSNDTFLYSDSERKLFILPCGYGLSYVGASTIDGVPLSSIMDEYIACFSSTPPEPQSSLLEIATHIQNLISDSTFSILVMCGYFENEKFVFSINTNVLEVKEHPNLNTLIYSGDSDILSTLINNFKYDYQKFNLADAYSFITLLNKTTASFQHFQQRAQTVSEDCDVLLITPKSTKWVTQLCVQTSHEMLHQ
ncbi:hypothetical protein Q5O14_07740 [Eubacteriaceae bacterium ES2]|nr:hypothetical protein Q5O14_07740 [Eubacteriaceae bacterium ES2]